MGILENYEEALLAGDYHSGPLSVIVPFGIAGALAFLWVLGAGWWVLLSNFRYGPPGLRRANTVLISYYAANCVAFFFIFGAFNAQLCYFLGAAGLSISLNGGVRKRPPPKFRRIALPKVYVMAPTDDRPINALGRLFPPPVFGR